MERLVDQAASLQLLGSGNIYPRSTVNSSRMNNIHPCCSVKTSVMAAILALDSQDSGQKAREKKRSDPYQYHTARLANLIGKGARPVRAAARDAKPSTVLGSRQIREQVQVPCGRESTPCPVCAAQCALPSVRRL